PGQGGGPLDQASRPGSAPRLDSTWTQPPLPRGRAYSVALLVQLDHSGRIGVAVTSRGRPPSGARPRPGALGADRRPDRLSLTSGAGVAVAARTVVAGEPAAGLSEESARRLITGARGAGRRAAVSAGAAVARIRGEVRAGVPAQRRAGGTG